MKRVETICIVDDDGLYTLLLRKKIEKLQLCEKIVTYPDGESAIMGIQAAIDANTKLPDIILLDINMPIMNGWEFMDAFAKITPHIRSKILIYISSSSIASEDRLKAQSNEAIESYLTKPLENEVLLRIAQLN
jgi:CheY-like chemotaxis protein